MIKNMAILDNNNKIINIIVCNDDEVETANQIIYTDTNPAYIGGDFVEGYFYPPQPYASWTRDKGQWISPVPYPTDGESYDWNEETESWDLVEVSE